MKLLIQETLTLTYKPLQGENLAEAFTLYREHTNKVSKKYNVAVEISLRDTEFECKIPAQKVCLGEWDMNGLFEDLIADFEYSMARAHIGGKGCDFAICLWQKVYNERNPDD